MQLQTRATLNEKAETIAPPAHPAEADRRLEDEMARVESEWAREREERGREVDADWRR
jgi:hypothetical protein